MTKAVPVLETKKMTSSLNMKEDPTNLGMWSGEQIAEGLKELMLQATPLNRGNSGGWRSWLQEL